METENKETKKCKYCNVNLRDYNKSGYCYTCFKKSPENKAYQKKYMKENREKFRVSNRKSFNKNKEKNLEIQRNYKKKNPQKIKEIQDRYRDKNKTLIDLRRNTLSLIRNFKNPYNLDYNDKTPITYMTKGGLNKYSHDLFEQIKKDLANAIVKYHMDKLKSIQELNLNSSEFPSQQEEVELNPQENQENQEKQEIKPLVKLNLPCDNCGNLIESSETIPFCKKCNNNYVRLN